MNRAALRGLYAITPSTLHGDALIAACTEVLAGGARVLQYRADAPDAATASTLRGLCTDAGALFIVNDDPELARSAGAHGVHLGREDAAIRTARALLGPDALIGASCYDDPARAAAAADQGADYLAFGSVMASTTKPDAVRAPVSLLAEARAHGLPVVAIGGITLEAAPELIAAGADALAVISDLFQHPEPRERAAAYAACFDLRGAPSE